MSAQGGSPVTGFTLPLPRRGIGARLDVELRTLGIVGLLWVIGFGQGLVWIWATADPGTLVLPPLLLVLFPQVVGLAVVATRTVIDLPTARWPRSNTPRPRPPLWPLFVGLAPLFPLAIVLVLRDRAARRRGLPDPEAVERAFHQLLRFPRSLGFRFLAWGALAGIVDVILFGTEAGWERPRIVATVLLWVALLGPLAAVITGWTRLIVRPECLTAPRPALPFRRTADLGLRLVVNATAASIGVILAPLCVGYLWSQGGTEGIVEAQVLAERMLSLADRGDEARLGRLLGEHSDVTVRLGNRRLGPDADVSAASGILDRNGDGEGDSVAATRGEVSVVVPLHTRPPSPPHRILVVGGLLCLSAAIGAIVLLARNVRRDVVRAAAQAQAVAEGRAPEPLREGSFSTFELRQLVVSVDKLVKRITEGNVAKYVAIEKAKEADRLKSQFLANMSHDLRSPLNSILGFSELLLTGIDGDLTAEQRAMVERIFASGRQLLQEIDDILDTAKIEASRLDLHLEPTPPAALVGRAIHNAKKRRENTMEYVVDVAPGLPPAFVDPGRTVQAIENVLVFASERMDGGTIAVRVRLGKTDRGRMIFVHVHTPVPPASAADLSRARRGFHRIPGHRGLGLGLPIAGSILELQGGSLSIEDLGDGMTFSLELCAPETRRSIRARELAEST